MTILLKKVHLVRFYELWIDLEIIGAQRLVR